MVMKKKVRTLEFYGFDYDSTMLGDVDHFPVSKVKEVKNMKYVIPTEDEEEESDEDSEDTTGTTENNG
jgi:hypothetical protein